MTLDCWLPQYCKMKKNTEYIKEQHILHALAWEYFHPSQEDSQIFMPNYHYYCTIHPSPS